MKLVKQFETGERIVSMIEFRGKVLVATSRGVYLKNDDNVFEPLKFAIVDAIQPGDANENDHPSGISA